MNTNAMGTTHANHDVCRSASCTRSRDRNAHQLNNSAAFFNASAMPPGLLNDRDIRGLKGCTPNFAAYAAPFPP